jgi:hypothetical protein
MSCFELEPASHVEIHGTQFESFSLIIAQNEPTNQGEARPVAVIQLPTTRTATRIHGRFNQITNAATMATATKSAATAPTSSSEPECVGNGQAVEAAVTKPKNDGNCCDRAELQAQICRYQRAGNEKRNSRDSCKRSSCRSTADQGSYQPAIDGKRIFRNQPKGKRKSDLKIS